MASNAVALFISIDSPQNGGNSQTIRSDWIDAGDAVKWRLSAKWKNGHWSEAELGIERNEATENEMKTLLWADVDYHILAILRRDSRRYGNNQQEQRICDEVKSAMISNASNVIYGTVSIRETGTLTFYVSICIKRQRLIRMDEFIDGVADLELQLDDGSKVFVSKLILSLHSEFFASLVTSAAFVEGRTGVCKLPNVKWAHLSIVLQRFYGFPIEFKCLSNERLTEIIELANRFQFDLLVAEIVKYITGLEKTEREKWFDVAERYQFSTLMAAILRNMDISAVKALFNQAMEEGHTNILQKYSPDTVNAIMKRLCSNGC
ncbi:hypothetical protein QR680_011467 [Steinernema hermaphroditum]|uniref:BTB domain-containing protein n=1 Tax=Steinernema hermaphroditum TaxID=289476 RepID=A0AA39HYK9_9BILA|nr:hypothetical protein QR680_011467 [Steinernema hermaphroditum]